MDVDEPARTIPTTAGRFSMDERILEWRLERLSKAGFTGEVLFEVALAGVDLVAAERLVRRGCPVETAARILL
jgi:hypothetical protein